MKLVLVLWYIKIRTYQYQVSKWLYMKFGQYAPEMILGFICQILKIWNKDLARFEIPLLYENDKLDVVENEGAMVILQTKNYRLGWLCQYEKLYDCVELLGKPCNLIGQIDAPHGPIVELNIDPIYSTYSWKFIGRVYYTNTVLFGIISHPMGEFIFKKK